MNANPTPATVLEVDGLRIGFDIAGRHVEAVHGLSFDVRAGETLAVIGESGSGKSLTALSLMGLLPRNARVSGSVRWHGQEIRDADRARIRALRGKSIALIPQDPFTSLNPVMTIGAQLVESMRAHDHRASSRELHERAVRLLEQVSITEPERRLRQHPHELSGGMRQRVVIAMAISNSPELIIADEATTALDVTVQAQVLDTLDAAREATGAALMLITHNMGVVAGRADRVLVMRGGEEIETGDVEDVFYRPASEYTRHLVDSIPRIDQREVYRPAVTAEEGAQPVLDIRSVSRWYAIRGNGLLPRKRDHVRAVDEVSLRVNRGETVAIVGESGSGKSTLIRSLFHTGELRGGSILFEGQDLAGLGSTQQKTFRRRTQMVFQDPYSSLDPVMTVRDVLLEPARIHRLDLRGAESRARELMRLVGLQAGHLSRYPNEFSGGQRQRIAIARALMTEPELLVLDEAVSALDVSVQAEILKLLMDIQDRLGVSYLFVSHDLSVIASLAHHVIVLYRGKVVEAGPTAQVLLAPTHPYTQALVSAVPVPDPRRERERRRVTYHPQGEPVEATAHVGPGALSPEKARTNSKNGE